jgi:hypothetical protein
MGIRDAAYARERRRLSVGPGKTADIVGGLIGAAISMLAPEHPTLPAKMAWGFAGAVGGVLAVEVFIRAVRFAWITPRTMYFDALAQVAIIERSRDDIVGAQHALIKKLESEREQRAQTYNESLGALHVQLATRRTNQGTADALTMRRTDGNNLNRVFIDNDDARAFREALRDWVRETKEHMKQLGCTAQEIAAFTDPSYSEFQRAPEFNEYENTLWNELKRDWLLRIDILGRIIDGYSERQTFSR